MHDLTCGRTCLFYRFGNTNSTPTPAVVMATNGKGRLRLIVMPGSRVHPNVPHRADPWVQDHGDTVRGESGGVWEYVEGEQPKGYQHIEVVKREEEAALRKSQYEAETGQRKKEPAAV